MPPGGTWHIQTIQHLNHKQTCTATGGANQCAPYGASLQCVCADGAVTRRQCRSMVKVPPLPPPSCASSKARLWRF